MERQKQTIDVMKAGIDDVRAMAVDLTAVRLGADTDEFAAVSVLEEQLADLQAQRGELAAKIDTASAALRFDEVDKLIVEAAQLDRQVFDKQMALYDAQAALADVAMPIGQGRYAAARADIERIDSAIKELTTKKQVLVRLASMLQGQVSAQNDAKRSAAIGKAELIRTFKRAHLSNTLKAQNKSAELRRPVGA